MVWALHNSLLDMRGALRGDREAAVSRTQPWGPAAHCYGRRWIYRDTAQGTHLTTTEEAGEGCERVAGGHGDPPVTELTGRAVSPGLEASPRI